MSTSISDARTVVSNDYDEVEDEDEEPKKPNKLVINILLVGSYLLTGVLVMTQVSGTHFGKAEGEHMSFITSLYIIMQIVTTIGYGDITVQTDGMRVFMAFYVLLGIVFIANVINDVGEAIITKESESMRSHMLAIRHKKSKDGGEVHIPSTGEKYKLYRLGAAFLIFAFFTLSWMFFFAWYEDCSCSYGLSQVGGCTVDNCKTTDAQTKNMVEAFYMAVITMTTVGFGDYTPQSEVGRVAGSIWMLLGVLCYGNMVTAIGGTISAFTAGPTFQKIKLTSAVMDSMDTDKNGTINRSEFLQYCLLKEGVITKDTVDEVNALFNTLDKDGSGELSMEDLEQAFDEPEEA